jgi:hypothetical protein
MHINFASNIQYHRVSDLPLQDIESTHSVTIATESFYKPAWSYVTISWAVVPASHFKNACLSFVAFYLCLRKREFASPHENSNYEDISV